MNGYSEDDTYKLNRIIRFHSLRNTCKLCNKLFSIPVFMATPKTSVYTEHEKCTTRNRVCLKCYRHYYKLNNREHFEDMKCIWCPERLTKSEYCFYSKDYRLMEQMTLEMEDGMFGDNVFFTCRGKYENKCCGFRTKVQKDMEDHVTRYCDYSHRNCNNKGRGCIWTGYKFMEKNHYAICQYKGNIQYTCTICSYQKSYCTKDEIKKHEESHLYSEANNLAEDIVNFAIEE